MQICLQTTSEEIKKKTKFFFIRGFLWSIVLGSFLYSLHSKICLSLGTSLRQSSVMLEIKAGPGKKNNEKTHEILKYEIAIFF